MRRRLRTFLLITFALALLAVGWLWWNRPQPVDMATYAPADALVYLEANSLPDILRGLAGTDAWQALAPPAGLRKNFNQLGLLSRVAAWTGIGPAETVILSRAQVAVIVMGLEAAEEPEQALHIKPRVAVIVETHTSRRRTQPACEKLLDDLARRTYGETHVERKAVGDAALVTWTNPHGLPLVAAFADTVVIIGNDEAAVQSCLAVHRGERAALASLAQLAEMRERMNSADALAFGYVPPEGARRLLAVAALAYAGRLSDDQKAQSAAAIIVPRLTERFVGGAAWSARVADGVVTDTYFLATPNGLTPRLRAALTADEQTPRAAADFLPPETYQFTSYDYRDPEAAWRELQATISAQLDIASALFVTRFLNAAVQFFGIADPHAFLRAAGPDLATIYLDETSAGQLLIARVRDSEALRTQVRKGLGSFRTERTGDVELWLGTEDEARAAAFVGDYLIVGDAEDVRRCLAARAAARALAGNSAYQRAARLVAHDEVAGAVTFADERNATRAFITLLARQRVLRTDTAPDAAAFARALDERAYSVRETRPVEGGFERRTRSAFGQFGAIVVLLGTESGGR